MVNQARWALGFSCGVSFRDVWVQGMHGLRAVDECRAGSVLSHL